MANNLPAGPSFVVAIVSGTIESFGYTAANTRTFYKSQNGSFKSHRLGAPSNDFDTLDAGSIYLIDSKVAQDQTSNVSNIADSMAVTKPFSPVILFDSHESYSETTQSADINISLASSGHLSNANHIALIRGDGSHAINIDLGAFSVVGVPDNTQNNILHFYRTENDVKPVCAITLVLKSGNSAQKLGTPTSVSAQPNGQLAWINAPNYAQAVVQRSTSADYTQNLVTVYTGSSSSYLDPLGGIPPGTNLFYRVKNQATGYTDSDWANAGTTTSNSTSAYQFSGPDQVMSVNNAGDLVFPATAGGSIGFWGYVTTDGHLRISQGTDTVRQIDLEIRAENGLSVMDINFTDSDGGAGSYLEEAVPTDITINSWGHYVFSWDGSGTGAGLKLYKNGIDVSAISHEASPAVNSFATGASFRIGKVLTIPSTGSRLKHLFVTNRAVTTSEVGEAYNGGTVKDISGTSFYNSVIAYWKFANNLNDSKGTHSATATTPAFV